MESNQFNFNQFTEANPGRRISGFDYVRAIYKTKRLPGDFLFWMAELISPTFIEIDGLVFVASQFSDDDYKKLLQDGRSPSAAQFWLNLLEISGLFDEIGIAECVRFAQSLCESWNLKLHSAFPATKEFARVIHDPDTDEVFIVVGHP